MIGFVSIFTGILVVIASVFLIRREFNRAVFKHPLTRVSLNDENTKLILEQLKEIEATVEQMNGSFYDLVGDLEGKYSIHDKEIELIQEDLNKIQNKLDMVSLRQKKSQISHSAPEELPVKDKNLIIEADDKDAVPDEIGGDKKSETIKKYRENGLSVNQIAREMNMGVGEVVLHLKRLESQ